jgi:hypothetical protein
VEYPSGAVPPQASRKEKSELRPFLFKSAIFVSFVRELSFIFDYFRAKCAV